MPNKFFSPSSLRWLTVCLLLVLAILLFILNLFPQNSQGNTPKTTHPTPVPPIFAHLTATTMGKLASAVAAMATADANATATAIDNSPIALVSSHVELPLMKLDATGLINGNPTAEMMITDQVKKSPSLNQQQAALVIIYVGIDRSDPTKMAMAQALTMSIEGVLQKMGSPVFIHKTIYQSIVFVGSETDAANDTLTGTSELNQANLEIYLYNTMHP